MKEDKTRFFSWTHLRKQRNKKLKISLSFLPKIPSKVKRGYLSKISLESKDPREIKVFCKIPKPFHSYPWQRPTVYSETESSFLCVSIYSIP